MVNFIINDEFKKILRPKFDGSSYDILNQKIAYICDNYIGKRNHPGKAFFISDRYEEINGIPLTDEWLLRCGGVALSDINSYEKEYTISGIYLRENKRNKGIFYCGETPLPYVHLLQNLYFFLRGKELQF